jgi:diacylglycerol kinase family enzyme
MLSAEGGPVAQAKPCIVCAAAVFALVLAAALVLGVFCAPAAHAKTVTSDEVADKWVFIGDSYATVKVSGHYVKKSWPEYLKSKLKIPASKLRIIRNFSLLYTGNIYSNPKVVHAQCKRIEIESWPQSRIEIDGEAVGKSPFTFEMVPQAIRVVVGVNYHL